MKWTELFNLSNDLVSKDYHLFQLVSPPPPTIIDTFCFIPDNPNNSNVKLLPFPVFLVALPFFQMQIYLCNLTDISFNLVFFFLM